MMFRRLLFLAAIFCVLSSCKSRKLGATAKVVEKSKSHMLNRLSDNRLDFSTFNGRGKIKYNDGVTRLSFTAHVRMRKDSVIWIKADVFGLEVARILIRPDSVLAINRYERTYVVDSYENFDRLYQIPATFSQLQDIILGNSLIDSKQRTQVQFQTPNYLVYQQGELYDLHHLVDGRTFTPIEIKVEDVQSGYEITSKLSDLKSIGKSQFFSYFRDYIIKKDNIQTASIQINYAEIDTKTKKKLPFAIPTSYTPADL